MYRIVEYLQKEAGGRVKFIKRTIGADRLRNHSKKIQEDKYSAGREAKARYLAQQRQMRTANRSISQAEAEAGQYGFYLDDDAKWRMRDPFGNQYIAKPTGPERILQWHGVPKRLSNPELTVAKLHKRVRQPKELTSAQIDKNRRRIFGAPGAAASSGTKPASGAAASSGASTLAGTTTSSGASTSAGTNPTNKLSRGQRLAVGGSLAVGGAGALYGGYHALHGTPADGTPAGGTSAGSNPSGDNGKKEDQSQKEKGSAVPWLLGGLGLAGLGLGAYALGRPETEEAIISDEDTEESYATPQRRKRKRVY